MHAIRGRKSTPSLSSLLPFAVGEDIQRSLPDGKETSPRASASPEKHQFCSPGCAIRSLYPFLLPGLLEPCFPPQIGDRSHARVLLVDSRRSPLVMFSLTTSALDGEKGTGKTLSLCHIIHFCAKQDWLVLHIPDGKSFLSPHRG